MEEGVVMSACQYVGNIEVNKFNGPVTLTWRSLTTSEIVNDFTNFQKARNMTRWIGDQMHKFL